MQRVSATALLVLFGLLVALGIGAWTWADAQEVGSTPIDQQAVDQCIGTTPIGVQAPPSCVFDANGNLISRSPSAASTSVPASSSLNLAPFIFLVLFWSAVPFVVAVSVARSRHEPVGTAVLLTLVLGWIGLLIVIYGQRRAAADVGHWVTPTPSPSPTSTSTSTPTTPASERLRVIDDLHAQGLISNAERDARRSAVIDAL